METASDTIQAAVKRCPRCGEEKPLTEFHVNRQKPDGHMSSCKSCIKYQAKRNRIIRRAQQTGTQGIVHKQIVNKWCQRCGLLKSRSEFHNNAHRADGLEPRCKKCRSDNYQASKQLASPGLNTDISDWLQVDSVLRTMGELQHDVNCAKVECGKRILAIKAECEQSIELAAEKIKCFNGMIAQFARKHCPEHETIVRQFRFGTLQVFRGEINVELRVDYAGEMRGKP